ncbi:metallophosphoesterase [Namhaeicola litoreus]|uniref:Metallophosphoesterase n=1 Tax=Namhaeicola litoreus TaxID=1052145 RepID=A0ABW3Y2N0_9FLAO
MFDQNEYDFTGTQGLYLEFNDGLQINWITKNKEAGVYELTNAKNHVLSKGETSENQIHKVQINDFQTEEFTLMFGGKTEGLHKINIRSTPDLAPSIFKNVDSVYVLGDVHGRYSILSQLLQKAKVIDENNKWIAGTAHLVFLGDLFDRGDEVTKLLWFIYELEDQAKIAGGKVHLVIGNHEIMCMTGDLRYVSKKENIIASVHGKKYDELFHPKKSVLGRWLVSKPSVIKINKNIFAHGGIIDLGTPSIEDYNNYVYTQMQDPVFLELLNDTPDSTKYDPKKWRDMQSFFYNQQGPYWFRGYVLSDTLGNLLDAMLKKYRSDIHVVAHTTVPTMRTEYEGKLIATDLDDAATEVLLMIQEKKNVQKFKINLNGEQIEIE